MPGMNGKGPAEKGPLTGGQRGVCKQTPIDKTDQPQGATADIVPGQGRGLGRGAGKGQGRGGNR